MKQSTKDQLTGSLHELKGAIKQQAGLITNNPGLTTEGHSSRSWLANSRENGTVRSCTREVGRSGERPKEGGSSCRSPDLPSSLVQLVTAPVS